MDSSRHYFFPTRCVAAFEAEKWAFLSSCQFCFPASIIVNLLRFCDLSFAFFRQKKQILPAIRRLAASKSQEGNELVVISHCSKRQEMCTHYVPLLQGKEFLAGQPPMTEHTQKSVDDAWFINWEQVKGGARNLLPFLSQYIDMLP